MLVLSFLLTSLVSLAVCLDTRMRRHDTSFEADYVLRVTYKPTSVACTSKELTLVNSELMLLTLRMELR